MSISVSHAKARQASVQLVKLVNEDWLCVNVNKDETLPVLVAQHRYLLTLDDNYH